MLLNCNKFDKNLIGNANKFASAFGIIRECDKLFRQYNNC